MAKKKSARQSDRKSRKRSRAVPVAKRAQHFKPPRPQTDGKSKLAQESPTKPTSSPPALPAAELLSIPLRVHNFNPADFRIDADEIDATPETPASTDDTAPEAEVAAKLDFSIVGVGASAGGLEAFSQLLAALPSDAGVAVVFVQHLSPDRESALPELLTASTSLPVVQVTESMPIEVNRVHVIPPGFHLSIENGRLHLSPRPTGREQHLPIDAFFRSLAEYAQSHAIGVVLSGTSSDGAAGLREIKAVGGITLAQDPKSAKYDGMPRAAIATDAVDLVLPPHEIAHELGRLIKHPLVRHVRPRQSSDEMAIDEEDLRRIFSLLRNATGVDFTHYKQPTIRRRLQRRMVLHKITSVQQYIKYLQQRPEEVQALYGDILIHVTRFFREPESFQTLSSVIFPSIVSHRHSDEPIRIWTPGCATGEEPYSIGIALLEYLGENAQGVPIQLFATDISEAAVDFARAGLYAENIADDVSPERLRRFFTRSDGGYRIVKAVRDLCVFARQDITRDPPFSRLDLIVCRNVLIYLGPVLQKKVMNIFHYALRSSGYLMLGNAETVGASADLFTITDKRHRLYTKKTASRADMSFSAVGQVRHVPIDAQRAARQHVISGNFPELARAGHVVYNEANRIVLDRFAPAGVIINEDLQIVQFRGQTGRFLEPAPGEASLSLLKMTREGLLHGLRSVLSDARRTNSPTRREGMRVKHDGHMIEVAIEVFPIDGMPEGRHFLVLFDDRTTAAHAPDESAPAATAAQPESSGKSKGKGKRPALADDHRVQRLAEELAASREYLQSIIQDLEAANEELQSANEEILSSNEELQSTNEELDTAKEELQSTNEELNTVNEELHNRNEELSRANSDLTNLLASVQIAIVMVAGDLKVRRFTPTAEKVLNLIPTDIGRPISDIKPNIECPDLERMIASAIDHVTTVEREVRDRQGKWYMLRIRPYKSLENKIDGAVLALLDTEGSRPRSEDAANRQLAETMLDFTDRPLLVLDADHRVRKISPAFAQAFGIAPIDAEGRTVYELVGGWDTLQLRRLVQDILPREGRVQDYELPVDGDSPSARTIRVSATKISPGDGRGAMVVLAFGGM
jgi:two-component system, chemotaxis family, CheB/CheR fusion protein